VAAEIFDREYRLGLAELYTGEGRCRVESEVLLPDYKEEAHRIIRVDTKTRVNSKNTYLQGQQLFCEVEGVATFNILYLADRHGEKEAPTSFLVQENFSYTFKIPSPDDEIDSDGLLSHVEVKAENISFKLLGPRKITMRSDISILLDLKCNRRFSYYSDLLPEDVQVHGKNVELLQLVTCYQEDLSFAQTISLPKGTLPIQEVCDLDIAMFAQEIRPEEGKVRFRGICDLHCSYVSQGEESLISFYQPIEFEKAMEAPQCDRDLACRIHLTPNFLKGTTDVNEEGENKNLLIEVGYTAEIRLFRNESMLVLEDVFSTKTELQTEKSLQSVENLSGLMDFSLTLRDQMKAVQEGMLRAEAIRASAEFKNCFVEDGKIVMEGKLYCRFLGITEAGELTSHDHTQDFTCSVTPDSTLLLPQGEESRVEICGGVRSVDLEPEGDKILMRIDLYGSIAVFCRQQLSLLSHIERGEEWGLSEQGILFVYPEAEESLWDLCKKYRVSPKELCEENEMDGEKIPRVVRMTKQRNK